MRRNFSYADSFIFSHQFNDSIFSCCIIGAIISAIIVPPRSIGAILYIAKLINYWHLGIMGESF